MNVSRSRAHFRFIEMASLSTNSVELRPKLGAFVDALRKAGGLKRVFLDPCTSSRETYSALAICGGDKALWYEDTCFSVLKNGDEVDLQAEIEGFVSSHNILSEEFGAVLVPEGTYVVEASVGNNSQVITDRVHFYGVGDVVCFAAKLWVPCAQAVLLQRTTFRGAKTFDLELLNGDKQTSSEIRLIPKKQMPEIEEWGTQAGMWVFRSPGNPVPSKLLLRAYKDGEVWESIARALTGEDSSSDEESEEDEWVPEEGSDSDESMYSDEEDDLLACLED